MLTVGFLHVFLVLLSLGSLAVSFVLGTTVTLGVLGHASDANHTAPFVFPALVEH